MARDGESGAGTGGGRVTALLGPTNTGKTHRAIERLLEFESGVIGLPLRLLAREVYDRLSARIGEQAVALVTGEEKRIPARPRYWVCTVEAMPLELASEFVAVDEIQLVGHPERGHVFTDRLLRARGARETWFLGSATVEGLVRTQLEQVRIVRLPRLSRLLHTGQSSLRTLPRRSAVVAFSMPQVYELADALRQRRGGAAVVLGALSPRVRNAQVALYQAGEVDFMVATDAIGMGLNLDIDHVALAGTVKFDGFETRELECAELAQIAGRAGRYLHDGTFGTLAPEPELSPAVVRQLEQHRFPGQSFAYYRNHELDFDDLDALLASLVRRPPRAGLRTAPEGDDLLVLRAFAKRAEITAKRRDASALRVLWDVCRIPNYEKRIPEHQAQQLMPLYQQLAEQGQIAASYFDEQLRKLEHFEGDIHALMERLASVRTFAYVSHQQDWLEQSGAFRLRTRALEDRLSDVLHERLLERFVEPRERRRTQALTNDERGTDAHHPFARLALLEIDGPTQDPRRARIDWVERLAGSAFEQLRVEARAELWFEGERVARLTRGPSLLSPQLKLVLPEWVEAGARSRIERRLTAHTRDLVSALLEPLDLGRVESAPLRGLSYQLTQGLGTIARREAAPQLAALGDPERALLSQHGIVIGKRTVYCAPLLASQHLTVREALCRAQAGPEPALPSSRALYQNVASFDRELALCMGFVTLARWAVRCDLLERLLALAPQAAYDEAKLMLGASDEDVRALLRELPRTRKRRRRR